MLVVLCQFFLCVGVSYEVHSVPCSFFFQAEDGIRDLVRSRGLGDVYKRQNEKRAYVAPIEVPKRMQRHGTFDMSKVRIAPDMKLSLIHI